MNEIKSSTITTTITFVVLSSAVMCMRDNLSDFLRRISLWLNLVVPLTAQIDVLQKVVLDKLLFIGEHDA